jgi:5-methylthioribose kinase
VIELTENNVRKYVLMISRKIWGKDGAVKILEAVEVKKETYVNYIFRVTVLTGGKRITSYLRQTRDHVKTRPEMKIEADRIVFEAKILRLINKIVPDLVPQVLYLDKRNNIAVLSDIKRKGRLLIEELVVGKAHPVTGRYFGKVLGMIHRETLGIENRLIRGGDEENQKAIDFHLGMRLGPAKKAYPELVANLIQDSQSAVTTLVMGDLASKNIFIARERVRFLDLERAFVWDPAFDLAFLFCHYLIEIKPVNINQSVKFIENFITGYRKEMGKKLSKNDLADLENRVIRYLGVTVLYRLFGFYLVRDLKRDKEGWKYKAEKMLGTNEMDLAGYLIKNIQGYE